MEQQTLGRTGVEVAALAFGCGAVGGLMVRGDAKGQARAVARALEAGMNYFDTAPSYGDGASETNLGRALREVGQPDRQLVIATKVRVEPADMTEPGPAIRRSLEASLKRLGRDHVELLHLHNAIGAYDDPGGASVPTAAALDQVAEGLRRLVNDGLAEHIGFTAVGETPALLQLAEHPRYETAQAYVNVLNASGIKPGASGGQQDFGGFVTHAAERGIGVIAIRVYAAGALTATAARHPIASLPPRPLVPGSDYEQDVSRARSIEELAREFGCENGLEFGLRFALSAPGIATALVGLSTYEHLEYAIRWAERGRLPDAAFQRVLDLQARAG